MGGEDMKWAFLCCTLIIVGNSFSLLLFYFFPFFRLTFNMVLNSDGTSSSLFFLSSQHLTCFCCIILSIKLPCLKLSKLGAQMKRYQPN